MYTMQKSSKIYRQRGRVSNLWCIRGKIIFVGKISRVFKEAEFEVGSSLETKLEGRLFVRHEFGLGRGMGGRKTKRVFEEELGAPHSSEA